MAKRVELLCRYDKILITTIRKFSYSFSKIIVFDNVSVAAFTSDCDFLFINL